MSTIAAKLTLQDHMSRLDPNGKVAKIVEVLNQVNDILADLVFVEGNLPTGHKTTIRSGLPEATWRQLNYGVQPKKSKTVSVTDTCGILASLSEVDKEVVDLNGNSTEFLLSESKAALESINQAAVSALFYGNTETDPEKFMGLAPRYDSTTAENGGNIIKCNGTGSDNTSVWLVTWGPDTCHMIMPKGADMGIWTKNEGEVMLEDASGGKYPGYRTFYQWKLGLCLRDWRYVVRIANIDKSLLVSDNGTVSAGADLISSMIKAIHKIPSNARGKMVFYCNETIFTYLDLQTLKQTNMNVKYDTDVHGKPVMTFRGIPVKKCEALLDTESAIS